MWDAIKYVSSAFTLVAFVAAAVVWALRTWLLSGERLIRAADSPEKARLIENMLEVLRLDTTKLTRDQLADLAIRQINERGRRFRTAAIVIVILMVLSAIIATVAFFVPRHEHTTQPRLVTLRLFSEGEPVAKSFSLVWQDPTGTSHSVSGTNGETKLSIPADIHMLKNLVLDLPCYEQVDHRPIEIAEGRDLVINLRKVRSPAGDAPLPPTAFPDPRAIIPEKDHPSKELLTQKNVEPGRAVLVHENRTGEFLHLLLYSFDSARAKNPWRVLPSDHCVDYQEFNGLTESIGWYAFIARRSNGTMEYLGRANLYLKPRTLIIIKSTNSGLVGEIH